ncbi:MAG: hypothetical protein HYY25_16950 [Candidatus Wallbacteria bacterium]|nr:hypothetical protein [Candidatus Wallbacteria bacterium]MBI4868622.1 hypothetical protein [Candidatus Wallbacteria bacterium]
MKKPRTPDDSSAGVILMGIAQLGLMLIFLLAAVAIYLESPEEPPQPVRSIIIASSDTPESR